MSASANKAILNRFWEELFNDGDLDVADEIVTKEYLNHDLVPGETPGREGLKQFVQFLHSAFPDIRFTNQVTVADDDKVVTRWQAAATHRGEFMGVPATGKTVQITGMSIHRVDNGQISEAWNNWDGLGMLMQLGVVPAPGG